MNRRGFMKLTGLAAIFPCLPKAEPIVEFEGGVWFTAYNTHLELHERILTKYRALMRCRKSEWNALHKHVTEHIMSLKRS